MKSSKFFKYGILFSVRLYSSQQMKEPIRNTDSLKLKSLKTFTIIFNSKACIAVVASVIVGLSYLLFFGFTDPAVYLNYLAIFKLFSFVGALSRFFYYYPLIVEKFMGLDKQFRYALITFYCILILTYCHFSGSWFRAYVCVFFLAIYALKFVILKYKNPSSWFLGVPLVGEKELSKHMEEDFPLFYNMRIFESLLYASFTTVFLPYLRNYFFSDVVFAGLFMFVVIVFWYVTTLVKSFVVEYGNVNPWEKAAMHAFVTYTPAIASLIGVTATLGAGAVSEIPMGRAQNIAQNLLDIAPISNSNETNLRSQLLTIYTQEGNGSINAHCTRLKENSNVMNTLGITTAYEMLQEKNPAFPKGAIALALMEDSSSHGTHPISYTKALVPADLSEGSKSLKRDQLILIIEKNEALKKFKGNVISLANKNNTLAFQTKKSFTFFVETESDQKTKDQTRRNSEAVQKEVAKYTKKDI